jgi:hypothetical protein
MLYRIEWDRRRVAVASPYSLAAFVAWLAGQPGDKQYRWQEYRGCVVHDYLLSVTGEEPDLSVILYSDVFASPHDYRLVCEARPHTYGAARRRAVALLARLGQPGGA